MSKWLVAGRYGLHMLTTCCRWRGTGRSRSRGWRLSGAVGWTDVLTDLIEAVGGRRRRDRGREAHMGLEKSDTRDVRPVDFTLVKSGVVREMRPHLRSRVGAARS